MESFSTHGLPASRKIAFWNEIASDTFAAMEIRPFDVASFDGRLSREALGALCVMDVQSAAVRIRHTREHVSRLPEPSYLLLAPQCRELELRVERSNAIRVNAGEFCLIDHARPYELTHGDCVHTVCIDIPRIRLEQRLPHAANIVGRRMGADNPASRLLARLLRELGNGGCSGLSPALAESVLSFIVATYASDGGPAPRAQLYRAYIESRLTDPDLTPAEVANHFRVSERYLRAVLGADGEPFSAYLLRRRLERCARLLTDPQSHHLTITQIAFQCGFSNATYFGQAFKKRYGRTPRDSRLAPGL